MPRGVTRCITAAQHYATHCLVPGVSHVGARRSRIFHHPSTIFCLLVALLCSLLPLGQPARAAAGDEWPQYRHDIQRSGRAGAAVAAGVDGKLHLQWAYNFGERVEVEVEPIVAGGRVFVGAMNGSMTALNVADGSVAWSFGAGPIAHTAAYANGRVFFGSLDGYVYALNAGTGALIWKAQTGGPVYAAPALAGGTVYIGSTAGRFFAFDAATGAARWSYPPGNARLHTAFTGAAALAPDGSRVYVGNEDLYARALDATTGTLIWQRQLPGVGARGTYPVVSDGGAVVIFLTTKPGVQSYLPTESYPSVAPGNDPTATWNEYYKATPSGARHSFCAQLMGPSCGTKRRGAMCRCRCPTGGCWSRCSTAAATPGFPPPAARKAMGSATTAWTTTRAWCASLWIAA